MILRKIKISELISLTGSAEYKSWKNFPVTPARAFSQSINPHALPDDIALFIALDDESGEILAYAGALPSVIMAKDATRFAWNSCWWAKEGAGAEAAITVFTSFLKTWNMKVAFSDMTEKTFTIIKRLGFCQTMQRKGVVLNIRPGFSSRMRVLDYSGKKWKAIAKPALLSGLPGLADFLTGILFFVPLNFSLNVKAYKKPVTLGFPEEKDFLFIQEQGRDNLCKPSAEELKMPSWLVKPDKKNKFYGEKYHFSSFAGHYSTSWLRWESEGKNKGGGNTGWTVSSLPP